MKERLSQMKSLQIKKTYPTDFEKIYPLLQEFDSPYSKEDWARIFLYRWKGADDYVGFHLEHDNNIVGFIGLLFSCREEKGSSYQFCNITSLIVKESYRSATLLLLRKLKSIENTIFTGLNPIYESYRLLNLMNFLSYETHYKVIPTINYLLRSEKNVCVYEGSQLLERVDSEHQRIVSDHFKFNCYSVLFEKGNQYCLLIYKVTQQSYKGFLIKKARILYVSDVLLFNSLTNNLLRFFNKKLGNLSAIYVDGRLVDNDKLLLSFNRKISPPRICFKPNSEPIEIDELYSEVVLL